MKESFPNALHNPYREVHVLLLSWEGGDEKIHDQLEELQELFSVEFGYQVNEWLIPPIKPHQALNGELYAFLRRFDVKNNLLVVYYGGHGKIDNERRCTWMR